MNKYGFIYALTENHDICITKMNSNQSLMAHRLQGKVFLINCTKHVPKEIGFHITLLEEDLGGLWPFTRDKKEASVGNSNTFDQSSS